MTYTKVYWQELDTIAKNAKQYIIEINKTVKAIQKFNNELNQIVNYVKSS